MFRAARVTNGSVEHVPPMQDECLIDKRLIYRKCLFSDSYNSVCLKAVRASILSSHRDYAPYYHLRLGEDLLQSLDIYKLCNKITFIGDALYRYTVNPNSVTHSVLYNNYTGSNLVRAEVLSFLLGEAVFSAQDYQDYHDACVLMYTQEVLRICNSATPMEHKIRIFRDMRRTGYYRKFICDGFYNPKLLKKKNIIFILHRCGFDRLAVWLMQLYSGLFLNKHNQ